MSNESYKILNNKISFDNFKGNILDLMLQIFEKSIDVENIDLIKITKQYLDFLITKEFDDKNNINNYLLSKKDFVYYAQIIYWRSMKLLPEEKKFLDNEEELLRQQEVQRLLKYKKIKDITIELRKLKNISSNHYGKYKSLDNFNNFSNFKNNPNIISTISIQKMTKIFTNMLNDFKLEKLQVIELKYTELSPLQFKTKILNFLNKSETQKWLFNVFLLKFSYNIQSLICSFLVILDLIFYEQIKILAIDKYLYIETIKKVN